jgi:hypothetical protein
MALEVVAADDAMHRAVLEHVADGRMEATTAMIAVWPQRGPTRSRSSVESSGCFHVMSVAQVGSRENRKFWPPRFPSGSLSLVGVTPTFSCKGRLQVQGPRRVAPVCRHKVNG